MKLTSFLRAKSIHIPYSIFINRSQKYKLDQQIDYLFRKLVLKFPLMSWFCGGGYARVRLVIVGSNHSQ